MRKRIGWWLRCAADRIDPVHAPRVTQLRYGFVEGVGLVVGWRRSMHPDVGSTLLAVSSDPRERDRAHDLGVLDMGWTPIPTK